MRFQSKDVKGAGGLESLLLLVEEEEDESFKDFDTNLAVNSKDLLESCVTGRLHRFTPSPETARNSFPPNYIHNIKTAKIHIYQ